MVRAESGTSGKQKPRRGSKGGRTRSRGQKPKRRSRGEAVPKVKLNVRDFLLLLVRSKRSQAERDEILGMLRSNPKGCLDKLKDLLIEGMVTRLGSLAGLLIEIILNAGSRKRSAYCAGVFDLCETSVSRGPIVAEIFAAADPHAKALWRLKPWRRLVNQLSMLSEGLQIGDGRSAITPAFAVGRHLARSGDPGWAELCSVVKAGLKPDGATIVNLGDLTCGVRSVLQEDEEYRPSEEVSAKLMGALSSLVSSAPRGEVFEDNIAHWADVAELLFFLDCVGETPYAYVSTLRILSSLAWEPTLDRLGQYTGLFAEYYMARTVSSESSLKMAMHEIGTCYGSTVTACDRCIEFYCDILRSEFSRKACRSGSELWTTFFDNFNAILERRCKLGGDLPSLRRRFDGLGIITRQFLLPNDAVRFSLALEIAAVKFELTVARLINDSGRVALLQILEERLSRMSRMVRIAEARPV